MLFILAALHLSAHASVFFEETNPMETDCDDGDLSTTLTCDLTGTTGLQNLVLTFTHTYAAATGVTCELWAQDNAATWSRVQTQAISAGTITLSDASLTKVTGSTQTWSYNWAIDYSAVRLVCTGDGSPTSSDLLTVDARLTQRARRR